MSVFVFFLLIAKLFFNGVKPSLAWGVDGHYATCMLAESLYSKATQEAIRILLPEHAEGNLASLCSWADEVRHLARYRWTSPLHFIDTPDFRCNYNYKRDCHNSQGIADMCAAGAINNFTSQLTTYGTASSYNLTEALLFLAHIVGDIHQPLHVGFTTDLGGNTIKVYWYRHKTNLHHVWDDEFIIRAKTIYYNSSLDAFVKDLSLNITNWHTEVLEGSDCNPGQIACPDVYASESIKAACKWAYKNATPGSHLSDKYFLSRLPIIEQQLVHGGIRLATILNSLFEKGHVASL